MTARTAAVRRWSPSTAPGDFFGEDILRGAAIGAGDRAPSPAACWPRATGRRGSDILAGAAIGALAGGVIGGVGGYIGAAAAPGADQAGLIMAVGGDLQAENAQLDRTQLAFNQLVDCRVFEAQRIRNDVRAGPPVAQCGPRADGLPAATDAARRRPGARHQRKDRHPRRRVRHRDRDHRAGHQAGRGCARVAAPGRPPARVRPHPHPAGAQRARDRPDHPKEQVTVRPAQGNFALVETASGVRGYVPASSVGVRGLGSRRRGSAAAGRMASSANWPPPTSPGATTSPRASRTPMPGPGPGLRTGRLSGCAAACSVASGSRWRSRSCRAPARPQALDEPPQQPFLRVEAEAHIAPVARLATDAAGSVLASVSDDKTLRLWNLPEGTPRLVIRPPMGTGPRANSTPSR